VHLVIGEPGIGKTRLAEEVAAVAADQGLTVAWGRAWETGGAPSFYPWIEVLAELGGQGAGAPSLEESRPTSGESVSSDSAHKRFARFESVAWFLRKRSHEAPLLLVFDDLHAADLPSLELLQFVSRSLTSLRISLVGTLRDVEARRTPVADVLARVGRDASLVSLGGLAKEDVARLVEEHTGQVNPTLTSELLAQTDGNPLFVAEALRMLDHGKALAPSSVLGLVASRIEGLGRETLELLDAASVFGRRIVPDQLARAAGIAPVEVVRRLGELSERGVLCPVDFGAYIFSHAIVRDVFYDRVAIERRREIHRAIATTLTGDGPRHAALVLHHALAAIPLVSAHEVIRASIAAAEAARIRLAPEDAVALLEKAALAVADLDASEADRIELLLALGWAATEAGALARGRQVFREASRRAVALGEAELVARAALGQGAELVFGEVRDELSATLRSALAGLSGSVDLRARLLARLAAALQPSTTPDEPVSLARQALAMAQQVSDPRLRSEVALAAGSALTDFAPPAERILVSEELVRTARSLDDAVLELRGLTRLATDWLEVGDFVRAESVIDARADLAAHIGHPRYLWQTPLLRSMLAMPRGEFALSDEAIEQASAIGQEGLDVNAAHVIAMHRFWMLLVRGDTEGLRAHLPEILRAMRRMPEPAQHHALVRAVVHARAGETAEARRELAAIGDGARMLAPMMRATIADAALLADDSARFPGLLADLAPARGRYATWGPFGFVCGVPYDAIVGALAARLGKRDDALASFAAALDLTRRSGASASEAWVHLSKAEALCGWCLPAAAEFSSAASLASKHGIPAILERAQAGGAAALPASAAPRSERDAPLNLEFSLRMTDKEAIVVCNGRTTRLRPVRGLPMLARLVQQPGRELHVLDLAAEPREYDARSVADRGDAGEILDAKARDAYHRRVVELREEIDEAERFADTFRADAARRELEMLIQQLSSSFGLGGRSRRVGSASERARVTVQRRVREAIKKIAEHEPELGRHLDWAIRTGTFCAYEPLGRKTAL